MTNVIREGTMLRTVKGWFRRIRSWARKAKSEPLPAGTLAAQRLWLVQPYLRESDRAQLEVIRQIAELEAGIRSSLDDLRGIEPSNGALKAKRNRLDRRIGSFLAQEHGLLDRALAGWPTESDRDRERLDASIEAGRRLYRQVQEFVELNRGVAEEKRRLLDLRHRFSTELPILWERYLRGAEILRFADAVITARGLELLVEQADFVEKSVTERMETCLALLKAHGRDASTGDLEESVEHEVQEVLSIRTDKSQSLMQNASERARQTRVRQRERNRKGREESSV